MKHLKAISTAVLAGLLVSCSTPQPTTPHKDHPYSGDHKVAQIRGMFSICLQTRQRVAPFWPVPMHIAHCDCIVDKSREKHSVDAYIKMEPGVLEEFFRGASIQCDKELKLPSIGQEPKKPDPAML